MEDDEVYDLLINYCAWDSPKRAKKLLKQHGNNIDVTDEDGDYFAIAMSKKSAAMIEVLLNHYDTVKLQRASDEVELKYLRFKLKNTLEEAIYNPPEDIAKLIKPYLTIDSRYSDSEKHYSDDDLGFVIDDDYELNCGSEYFEPMSDDVDLAGNSLIGSIVETLEQV